MQQPFHASLRTMDAELLMICLASDQYNQLDNNLVDILLDFISIAKVYLTLNRCSLCFEFLSATKSLSPWTRKKTAALRGGLERSNLYNFAKDNI